MEEKSCYNLILLGGTGARCGEIFIHMCANGYFKAESINILLIDSDTENGNAKSLKTLIKTYNKCNEKYVIKGSPIPSFFKTEINFMEESPVKGISYFKDLAQKNLKDSSSIRKVKILMRTLYTEDEMNMKITDGFFARPNVGAALFASNMESILEKFIWKIKNRPRESDNIKIFMIGSIFGGTGASSLPTISKYIKTKIYGDSKDKLIGDKLKIGGCLMLPYFSFTREKLKEEFERDTEIKIESNKFINKTRFALEYYKDVNSNEERRIFDQLFIMGHDGGDIRGYYNVAGAEQKNLPHITELYSAMSCVAFFKDQTLTNGNYLAVIPNDMIKWTDFYLPNECFYSFYLMMRFSIVLKSLVMEELFTDKKLRKTSVDIPWYYDFIYGKEKPLNFEERNLYAHFIDISKYCNEYIRWFSELKIANINKVYSLGSINEKFDENDVVRYIDLFTEKILFKQHENNLILDGYIINADIEANNLTYKKNLKYIRKKFQRLEEHNILDNDEKNTDYITLNKIWSRLCDFGFNTLLKEDDIFKNIETTNIKTMEEGVRNLINAIYIACMI